MARYNLTTPETQIVTTWLFEPGGYLDAAINDQNVSAMAALQATPTLDVTVWIRTHTPSPTADPENWTQTAMVWWIRASDGVNITPPTQPPERTAWIAILEAWSQSINDGFVRSTAAQRNATRIDIYDSSGTLATTMPAGSHLQAQQSLISKALAVLT